MLWRLEAKGYSRGWAWLEENNWVYRIGLLGYVVFALSVYALSTTPTIPDPTLFHVWVWVFFWIAHLPDLFAHSTVRGHRRFRCLLAPSLISATNITTAFLMARSQAFLIARYPSAGDFTLSLAAQGLCVGAAYLVHFLVNLLLFSASAVMNRLSRLRLRTRPISIAAPGPSSLTPPSTPEPHESTRPRAQPDPTTSRAPPRPARFKGLLNRLHRRRCRLPSDAPQPILELLHTLSHTPPTQIRPTLKLVALAAMESAQRLKTPILLDVPERSLFLADGTFNPTVAASFLAHLPRIHHFVPDSKLGKRVYRPVARRLARELRGAWPRLLRTLTAGQAHPQRVVADLLLNASPERPIFILCVGSPPLEHGRPMKKILCHLIRRNALRHLATAKAVSIGPEDRETADPTLLRRVVAQETRRLNRAGVRELDEPLPLLSETDLREATLILVPDTATAASIRQRLGPPQSELQSASATVVELPTLLPAEFSGGSLALSAKTSRAAIHRNLAIMGTVLAESICPPLLARAAHVETPSCPPRFPAPTLEPGLDPNTVPRFRAALRANAQPAQLKRRGVHPERLLKLIWSIAQRDGSTLLMHGLPECLRSTEGDWSALDDESLRRCWANLPFVAEVVPRNRVRDYRPAWRLLRHTFNKAHGNVGQPRAG